MKIKYLYYYLLKNRAIPNINNFIFVPTTKNFIYILFIFSILVNEWSYSETENTLNDSVSLKNGIVGAPFAAYAPETGFEGGIVGIYYFRLNNELINDKPSRPLSISGGVRYTQKRQFSSGIDYDFYFFHDNYHLSGGFDYKKYPYDFFGVGSKSPKNPIDNYTPLWIGLDFIFSKNFIKTLNGEGLNFGIGAEVRHDKMLVSKDGGILKTGSVPGSAGGLTSGLGLVLLYDTCDNVFSTLNGIFLDLRAMHYGRVFGSDYNFERYSIDLRYFKQLIENKVFALQGICVLTDGTEPFYSLAGLGGDANLRGYLQGRFRDKDMAVVQMEYRIPLFWRFGLVTFADAGAVASKIKEFNSKLVKFSIGPGLRFFLDRDERLGVRLDYGIGSDSSEIYFSILEAF